MLKKLRGLSIIVAVLFLISGIFSACGKQEETSKPAESTTAEQTTEETKGPPIEILWSGPSNDAGNGVIITEAGEIGKELEQIFNVVLKPVPVDIWAGDSFNVLIGSGTIPDSFVAYSGENITNWVNQGVIREVSKEMILKFAPTVAKRLDEIDKSGWVKASVNGKLWGVPAIDETGGISLVDMYRLDWAEKVGITKRPETLDEVEIMLRKFTFEDPDGNGKNDTFGTSYFSEWDPEVHRFNMFFGAFGVQPKQWMKDDSGNMVFSGIHPKYKEALKYIQKLYKEGVIDPEFIVQKQTQYADKYNGNYFGYKASDYISSFGSYVKEIQDKIPGAKMDYIPKITGPDGEYGNLAWGSANGWVMVFGKDVQDEKVARILEMLEKFATDEEVYKLAKWGKEGVHYDLSGDKIVPKPDFSSDDARSKIGLGAASYGFYTYLNKYSDTFKFYFNSEEMVNINNILKLAKPMKNEFYSITKSNDKYGAEINTIFLEFYNNAIVGKIDIDSTWDKYVDDWKKAGGDIITQEVNEMYKNEYLPALK